MRKTIRVKLLLLLTLGLTYGGMKAPADALVSCPIGPVYNCGDVYDFCTPATGCAVIRFTYIGECDGVATMAVSCAACSTNTFGYCNNV